MSWTREKLATSLQQFWQVILWNKLEIEKNKLITKKTKEKKILEKIAPPPQKKKKEKENTAQIEQKKRFSSAMYSFIKQTGITYLVLF